MTHNLYIHNKFEVEVVDVETGRIKQKAIGYNTMCARTFSSGYCDVKYVSYGDGSGSPSYSDGTLFNYLGYKTTSLYNSNLDLENGIYYMTRKAVIESSEAVGKHIREVGLGQNSIYTHAMLKDQNGNNISILKTSTDVINIYAIVYLHFNPRPKGMYFTNFNTQDISGLSLFTRILALSGDFVGSYNVDNVGFHYHNFQHYSDTAKLIPKNEIYNNRVRYSTSWNSTSKKYSLVSPRLEAAQANSDCGFRYVTINRIGYDSLYNRVNQDASQYICRVGDEWFPYSTIENEAVGTGDGTVTDFKLKFMYPRDVVVKINGILNTDFTVDYAPPTTNLSPYVDVLSPSATLTNLIPRKQVDTTTLIIRNPAHVVGISSITANSGEIFASNDLETWTSLGTMTATGTFTIPEGSENYIFYKFNRDLTEEIKVTAKSTYTGYNLHFNTAPSVGDIIIASYKADCIAKDSNRVFDFKLEIALAEYTT